MDRVLTCIAAATARSVRGTRPGFATVGVTNRIAVAFARASGCELLTASPEGVGAAAHAGGVKELGLFDKPKKRRSADRRAGKVPHVGKQPRSRKQGRQLEKEEFRRRQGAPEEERTPPAIRLGQGGGSAPLLVSKSLRSKGD